jgi:putative two-component system response regulator
MSSQDEKAPRSTILVVDDSPENLTVLSAVLRPDYRVRVATEGFKAISIVESDDPPDLILLDVMMPGMSGFEVCEKLKANPARKDVPIIFVTALGEVEDERHGLELGAIDYITKPISPSIVSARVRNHLELKHAREALARQNAILEVKVAERTADLVRANKELKESYLETIDLAYAVMSEADDQLASHCRRVATYAKGIAEKMGFSEDAIFDVHVAALLHDLGLVGVHGSDLQEMFRLTHPSPTHDKVYWSHPIVQVKVLLTSERFSKTAAVIAGHHENLDGTGFPARAKGDEILLGSRILAVADRWDMFAQFQPVQKGVELTFGAFAARHQGKLDPDVLSAFSDVLAAGDPFSKVVERKPEDLLAGMVVARTIRTTGGAVLLSAGTALRKDHIRDLTRYAAQQDIQAPIFVYREAL